MTDLIFFIDGEKTYRDSFENELYNAMYENGHDFYDDALDDCYPVINIGCCEFFPSYVLKECDPIAYKCGYDDYIDGEYSDAIYNFDTGYTDTIGGIEFKTEYTDDEYDEGEV